MTFYNRKRNRLKNFDYSTENHYFITICSHEKQCIFGHPQILNDVGKIVEGCILQIPKIYPQISVDNYIVMPNHVHIILAIEKSYFSKLPNICNVIGQFKMMVTKQVKKIKPIQNVWQRSFHDRIIRNQREYEKIWNYVEYNDQKWMEDCFYLDTFREGQCPSPTEWE